LIAARENPTWQYDRFYSSSPEIPGKNEDEKNNLNMKRDEEHSPSPSFSIFRLNQFSN
jgi:hypothetical protein